MQLKHFGWKSDSSHLPCQGTLGRVALSSHEHFLVWTERGEVQTVASGSLRHQKTIWPCVGDWVVLRDDAVIIDVLPRHTQLSRKRPGTGIGEQILAANIDVLFIVSGLDDDYNSRRLERYLVLAHESRARPVVVLNKADLRSDYRTAVEETARIAEGASVIAISALFGWGIDALLSMVSAGETAALMGSSGAGKSTILNRLLREERQQTYSVRESDSRGRHTTTRRELFLMPEGWLLMDLPGLRELQLWTDPEQVDQTFADIMELAKQCRFRDCTHQHEPDCAVRQADLDPDRVQNFHKMKRELAYLDRQLDFNLVRNEKKRFKALERAYRRHPKH